MRLTAKKEHNRIDVNENIDIKDSIATDEIILNAKRNLMQLIYRLMTYISERDANDKVIKILPK